MFSLPLFLQIPEWCLAQRSAQKHLLSERVEGRKGSEIVGEK